jgi:hypothetical protein
MNNIPQEIIPTKSGSLTYCAASIVLLVLAFLILPTFLRGGYLGKDGLIAVVIFSVASVWTFFACPNRPLFGKIFTLTMMTGVLCMSIWIGLLYERLR